MFHSILTCIVLVICGPAFSQDGNRTLERHLNTMGQEFWDQIQDIKIEGKWVNEAYKAYPVSITLKSPAKIRIEGTWEGKKFVEATDGTAPWMIAPWKESTESMAADPVEQLILNHVIQIGSPLADEKENITFEGLKSYEGTMYTTYRQVKENTEITYYLSRDTDLITYKEVKAVFHTQSISLTFYYEKYKEYHGMLKVPIAVQISGESVFREFAFDDFSVGLGAPDQLFKRPDSQ